jgi:hypothetical protein
VLGIGGSYENEETSGSIQQIRNDGDRTDFFIHLESIFQVDKVGNKARNMLN